MAEFYLVYLASKGATFLSFLCKICLATRCRMMGRFCFLIALCSFFQFYKRAVFQAIVFTLFLMDCVSSLKLLLTKYNDFGCGFFIIGCFSKHFNVLFLFFMLILGFVYLQNIGVYYKFRGKSSEERKGFSLTCYSNDGMGAVENLTFENGTTKMSRALGKKRCGDQKLEEIDEIVSSNCGFHDRVAGNGEMEECKECCHEDQVFDVIALRNMVKVQRQRANTAHSELEKERMAASSSVDEAMAMILRLQNEKSVLQMQVNQLQRASEDKHSYDQEAIQSLQWIIMKHESERSILEDQLRICREKIKLFVKGEEWDQFDGICPTPSASHSSFGSRVEDLPIGLFDFESSPL